MSQFAVVIRLAPKHWISRPADSGSYMVDMLDDMRPVKDGCSFFGKALFFLRDVRKVETEPHDPSTQIGS
jgi:hypothetical protein